VLLSFRRAVPDDRYAPGGGDLLRSRVPALVDGLHTAGQPCAFVWQVDEDEALNTELAARCATGPATRIADPSDYAGAGLVLSNRLHVLLVAAAQGALPVALVWTGHRKVRDLYETVGWDDLVLDLDGPGDLPGRLAEILTTREAARARVAATFADAGRLVRRRLAEMVASATGATG
jgi:hypothetical protein